MESKLCPDCKIVKSACDYSKNAGRPGGLAYCCKLCKKVRDADGYARNRTARQARHKVYRQENKDFIQRLNLEYYHKNKEQISVKQKQKYARMKSVDPDYSNRRHREWKSRHPGRKEEYDSVRRNTYKQKWSTEPIPREGTKFCWSCDAQVLKSNFSVSRGNVDGLYNQCIDCCRVRNAFRRAGKAYTREQWLRRKDQFGGKCAYGGSCRGKIHADHFYPLCRGGSGTIENIVPACERHNLQKNGKDPNDWIKSKYGEEHPLLKGVPPFSSRKDG